MLAHRYVKQNGSAAMLAAKRSAGVTLEVNLGEHLTHTPLSSANEPLKPRGDVTRSPKEGYQWPHEKDLCLPKKQNKKNKTKNTFISNLPRFTMNSCHVLFIFGQPSIYVITKGSNKLKLWWMMIVEWKYGYSLLKL